MKSKKWYAAIRKANSGPKSKEHRAAISKGRLGIKPEWDDPEGRTQKIVEARNRNIELGGCEMCGSFKHTMKEHKARAAEARSKSKLWKQAVSDVNQILKTGQKASEQTRKRMSKSQFVAQNKPEQKKLISQRSKEMWAKRTKEEVEELAEKISKTQRGRIPNFDRFGQYYDGKNGKIWMRSSYEVKFAEWLDKHGIYWQFEPESFYVGRGDWNGSEYTPDFYIPGHDIYVETKGYLRDENIRKLEKFFQLWPLITRKWYMLGRDGLMALGVL